MTFDCCFTFWEMFGYQFFVNPGKVDRKPLSIALMRVDLTGKPSDAWCSLARSFFVVSDRMTALHALDLGRDG